MSDELILHEKQYVSSKKAAEQTGYARDYIGQLARGGLIDAERVGGLWYVSLESLEGYEKNAETARAFSPVMAKDEGSALSFEGKEYVSASRAAKITGYNQDYVGQLARGGKIPSRQIGNRWYVDSVALVQHKAEKDALLAAVQADSVGIESAPEPTEALMIPVATRKQPEHILVLPQMTYTHESHDLLPNIPEKSEQNAYPMSNFSEIRPRSTENSAPIPQTTTHVIAPSVAIVSSPLPRPVKRSRKRVIPAAVGVLTIILVLSVGIVGMQGTSTFAGIQKSPRVANMTAGAAEAVGGIGDVIENLVSPALEYRRER